VNCPGPLRGVDDECTPLLPPERASLREPNARHLPRCHTVDNTGDNTVGNTVGNTRTTDHSRRERVMRGSGVSFRTVLAHAGASAVLCLALPGCRDGTGDPQPAAQVMTPVPTVMSVALRVHHMARMEAFFTDAFGVQFRTVETGPFASRFGTLGSIVLKLVPIRDADDFVGFPVHQLGVDVRDIDHVVRAAVRHGGRLEDSVATHGDSLVAAIRDPDGNTIELRQLRRRGA
jgi:predicted enzyme related to lactoylglutathione lyase